MKNKTQTQEAIVVDYSKMYSTEKFTLQEDARQINEIFVNCEHFDVVMKEDIPSTYKNILKQGPSPKGELTDLLAFNIETYCQGTGNGLKGVSRVVIVNDKG